MHGVIADEQALADPPIARSAGDEPNDLEFAACETGGRRAFPARRRGLQLRFRRAGAGPFECGGDAAQCPDGVTDLIERRGRVPKPAERAGQVETRARRFKGRATVLEQIDRVLETAPGPVVVTGGRRDDAPAPCWRTPR